MKYIHFFGHGEYDDNSYDFQEWHTIEDEDFSIDNVNFTANELAYEYIEKLIDALNCETDEERDDVYNNIKTCVAWRLITEKEYNYYVEEL